MKILFFTDFDLSFPLLKECEFYNVHIRHYHENQALDKMIEKIDALCFMFQNHEMGQNFYDKIREINPYLPLFSLHKLEHKKPDSYCVEFPSKVPSLEAFAMMREALALRAPKESKHIGPFVLDRGSRRVTYQNQPIQFTFKEFEILELLLLNHGRVISRDQIIHYAWDQRSFVSPNTIDVYISRIKRKIGSLKSALKTIYNYGYELQMDGLGVERVVNHSRVG